MKNVYGGLCVGGPMDGKSVTHWASTYTLESISGYVVEYTHRPLTDACALWVPKTDSLDNALESLGEAYAERAERNARNHPPLDILSSQGICLSMANKRGRPTDYKASYCKGAQMLAELGATDKEIADFFEVHVATLHRWKNTHPDFCDALKVGKEKADERVTRSLYHKAIGYEQEQVKIFMPAGADDPVYAPYTEKIAPDTTAAIFWLKNRRPDLWRDKVETDHTSSDGTMTPQVIDASGLSDAALQELMNARKRDQAE